MTTAEGENRISDNGQSTTTEAPATPQPPKETDKQRADREATCRVLVANTLAQFGCRRVPVVVEEYSQIPPRRVVNVDIRSA